MLRIAEYSRDSLKALRAETGVEYDNRAGGLIQLFRTDKQRQASDFDKAILDRCNVPYQALSVDELVTYEPALAHLAGKLTGGLRLPGDETGDCCLFTQRLTEHCKRLGVEFRFNTDIRSLNHRQSRITGVDTSAGELTADRYLVALGSYSPMLVKPLGIHLPIYPVKGYSITLPVEDASRAPVSTVMDETYKVAVSRLGDRIRVGGTAELTGYDLSLPANRRRNVEHVVSDLFGGAGDPGKAEFWTGLRPMTPDGTPIIGPTPIDNLYLNTGHGTLGWTMSVGSARVIADLISERRPEISPDGLSLSRYTHKQQGDTHGEQKHYQY
jgi:D-amino-acid dehydrogenase